MEGKVVVVTGGAGLLGRAICSLLAESGATVVVADLNIDAAHALVDEITRTYPDGARAESLDITDVASINDMIQRVAAAYGHIDAVVSNAYPRNANYGRKLEDVTYADFCDSLSTHLGGYFLVAQQFGLFFRKQRHGHILNMASVYGVIAPRFEIYDDTDMTMPVEYAAIKSAIIHLTKYFAKYFRADNVRVNSISPGGIENNQPASFIGRYNAFCASKGMLDPADVASVVMFMLSDPARSINGQNIVVDDGFTL